MNNLTRKEITSLGGKANAIIQRKHAEEKYYKNPNHCLLCKKIISIKPNWKVAEIKKKKFCNRKCFGEYSQIRNQQKFFLKRQIKILPQINISSLTKGQLFKQRKNWQSARTAIRRHAKKIFSNQSRNHKTCCVCGYDRHIEIAHKKPVHQFSDDITIKEINDINNLIGLCPNCHWEYDNKILTL